MKAVEWVTPDSGMMRPWDVKASRTYHRKAIDGREFLLRMRLPNGNIAVWKHKLIMDALKHAIAWRRPALWAEVLDYEHNPVISKTMMRRLWWAADHGYGRPNRDTPFRVKCEVYLDFIHEYYSMTLLDAIDFASFHYDNGWEDTRWTEVRGPNNWVIMPRRVTQRMYHAWFKAAGGSITASLIVVESSFMHGVQSIKTLEHRVIV